MDDYKDIVINLRDGTIVTWDKDDYEDYSFEGSVFVVKKNHGEWVGIYNMRDVISVEVGFPPNAKNDDNDKQESWFL